MKTISDFGRHSLKQGPMPLATSRLELQWLGKTGGFHAAR